MVRDGTGTGVAAKDRPAPARTLPGRAPAADDHAFGPGRGPDEQWAHRAGPQAVLDLQRTAGNRATAALLCRTRAAAADHPPPAPTPAATDDAVVQRHSSFEHKLLGDAPTETLAKMGAWQDLIEQTEKGGEDSAEIDIEGVAAPVTKGHVMHVLVQEMRRLQLWQEHPPTAASTDDGTKKTELDPTFEVVIVRLPSSGGKPAQLVTYGELNTLADFYGDLETMKAANPKHRNQLVQSVRKETFLQLKVIYDKLTTSLTDAEKGSGEVTGSQAMFGMHKLGKTGFKGAAVPDFISGVKGQADLLAGDTRGIGQGTGAGGGVNAYGSTLARNACHFVPESWHSWADYHAKARVLAGESNALYGEVAALKRDVATDHSAQIRLKSAQSAAKANEALLSNGFGDHYLQDSYAAGHMINKTQVMQWYVEYIDKNDEWDYFKDKNWRKVQQMAYRQNLADPGQYAKANVKGAVPGNVAEAAPRNPQSVESHVGGGWHNRFLALGLQVPESLRVPGSNTRRVMEWWQMGAMGGTVPKERTGAELALKWGQTKALEDTMLLLVRDGIVRPERDITVRGGVMSMSDQALARASFSNFRAETFILREDYIPKGHEKKMKFLGALKKSRAAVAADDSDYQKMAASVTYGDYLMFMKSTFIQKATNALHDTFCKRGLNVSSGAGAALFKVYGDDSMFNAESSKGVAHSGVTSNMSRDSIRNIIDTGADGGVSAASILDRLPSRVQFDVIGDDDVVATVEDDIEAWHNSSRRGALKDECMTKVFPGMSGSFMQKAVPGLIGGDLGVISKDEKVHGADAF